MNKGTIYLKAERKIEVHENQVLVKDIARVTCGDKNTADEAGNLVVVENFTKEDGRIVVTVLKVIETILQSFPDADVESLGETETLVLFDDEEQMGKAREIGLTVFVAAICFFGTAFTIMAFHNDIGIQDVFSSVYEIVTGETSNGITILEVSYSAGLAAGIILFFNHIGGRRITKDPTPVEVEMRMYENDVDTTLVESCGRKGNTVDVE